VWGGGGEKNRWWGGGGGGGVIKSDFLWGVGFPELSRRIARKVFSSVWVALDWRPTVVGEIYLQGSEGRVRRMQVLGDLT